MNETSVDHQSLFLEFISRRRFHNFEVIKLNYTQKDIDVRVTKAWITLSKILSGIKNEKNTVVQLQKEFPDTGQAKSLAIKTLYVHSINSREQC